MIDFKQLKFVKKNAFWSLKFEKYELKIKKINFYGLFYFFNSK